MISIATKLIATFLLVIVLISVIFSLVGVQFIGSRIVSEAQSKVRTDLNAAREIYLNHLHHVSDVVRFTGERFFLRDALLAGKLNSTFVAELVKIKTREKLDILSVTDASGVVLLRTNNGQRGDDQSQDAMIREMLRRQQPVAATALVSADELRKESPALADRAHFRFIETPKARARPETEETAGMMLKAAAPIFDYQNNLIGIVYGGELLNRNFELVDRIKQTVFQGVIYKGKDIGTATIFQDDLRISTNVRNADGSRAIGTRGSEEVYIQVVKEGKPWVGRAYVVNDWYITAYEPIRNIEGKIVGILYVGILEQKYLDIKHRSIVIFLALTLLGAAGSMALAYFISRRISVPIQKLVSASREVAHGHLDARVEVASQDELRELADSFNAMAFALQTRDERLKEFTRNRIMESERLAIIGQLAANVAHELNNPLQGIVSYSHLLLERMPRESPQRESVQKLVQQANRCTTIIRALLDFSRPRQPQKRPTNINALVEDCVSLVGNQALFHNIWVRKELRNNLPLITVDPSEIQQVLINMIMNAAEAMNGEGQLTLATRLDAVDNCVEVEVTDTGHGISEENIERMFDPFFTTKEAGHGTGLGLAISYGIIKEHQGTISVESEVGKGTTFVVRLPITTKKEAVACAA